MGRISVALSDELEKKPRFKTPSRDLARKGGINKYEK